MSALSVIVMETFYSDWALSLGTLLLPIAGIMLVLLCFILISLKIGKVAESKGRSRRTFFWLSLLLPGPLTMGIIVAAMSPFCFRCGTPGWAHEFRGLGSCSGCVQDRSVDDISAGTRRGAIRERSSSSSNPATESSASNSAGSAGS